VDGGAGRDIILGGLDGGAAPGGAPNSDIMFGAPADDVNLWASGDGSETFIGGPGLDAVIFRCHRSRGGRTGLRLPTLRFVFPTFVTGIHSGREWCGKLLHAGDQPLQGYDYLVRFRGRATGNIIVAVRLRGVEQVGDLVCPCRGRGAYDSDESTGCRL